MSSQSSNTPDATQFDLRDCRWIVFDAVGTLIEPSPPVAAAYHAVGSRFGSKLTMAEVGQRFRQAFHTSESDGFAGGPGPTSAWQTSDQIEEARWQWIVTQVLSDASDPEICFRELWDHFARPTSWRCFDDVAPSLSRLSAAGYQFAIASNFDRRLHAVCNALEHLKSINCRIVSASIGVRKPSPLFYTAIIQACGCAPHQILMVGDSSEHDVLAPRAAGLRALHLNRKPPLVDHDSLTSLEELAARLTGSLNRL
jgi:putative hydrolase of the HAD superfamily